MLLQSGGETASLRVFPNMACSPTKVSKEDRWSGEGHHRSVPCHQKSQLGQLVHQISSPMPQHWSSKGVRRSPPQRLQPSPSAKTCVVKQFDDVTCWIQMIDVMFLANITNQVTQELAENFAQVNPGVRLTWNVWMPFLTSASLYWASVNCGP